MSALVALAALAWAQASVPASAPASAPTRILPSILEPPKAGDEVVARVDEASVRLSDLGRAMLFHAPGQSRDVLRNLALNEVVRRDAERLGVYLRSEDLDEEVAAEMKALADRVAAESGGKRSLGAFLREEVGASEEGYRADLARFVAQRRFLALVVRYEALLGDRVVARVLTTTRREEAEEILAKVREGADFAVLARERSAGPARAEGGKLPPFSARWDHPIARAAASLAPGAVAGPVEETRASGSIFHLVRLIERLPGRRMPFAEAEPELREELRRRPLEKFEVERWDEGTAKRLGVEVLPRRGA